MVTFIRWLLFPFSMLYAGAVWIRNWAYDNQLCKSTAFRFPIVVIGNLAVGGTGKSPMTEYVLRLIKSRRNIAVLSRGYGRKTKGFRYVEVCDTATSSGDEPLQIKRKFPDVAVTVCEDRVYGIQQIQEQIDAVLLDDAYQHRKLRPSFSILLLDYDSLQHPIIPLPTGDFREQLHGCKRASVIVITKCPQEIPDNIKFSIASRLRKYTQAPIFYTKITYQKLQKDNGTAQLDTPLSDTIAVVVTGIAKPQPLLTHLEPQFRAITHLSFPDHHYFSKDDLDKISNTFQRIDTPKKVIITTEKDMQRLPSSFLTRYPVYFIPIDQAFLFDEAPIFDAMIKKAFQIS